MHPLASLLQVLKNKNVQKNINQAVGATGIAVPAGGGAAIGKAFSALLGNKPQQAPQKAPVPMGPVKGPNPAYGFNMQGGYQNPQQPFPRGRYAQPQQFSPSVMQAGWDMPMQDLEILRRPLQGGYADQGNINLMGY